MMIVGQSNLVSKIECNPEICIGDTVVKPSATVCNIGAIFDSEMKMLKQFMEDQQKVQALLRKKMGGG